MFIWASSYSHEIGEIKNGEMFVQGANHHDVRIKLAVLWLCSVLFAGCSTLPTRNEFYPNFSEQQSRLQKIRILGDFIAVKNGISGQYVDIDQSVLVGKKILEQIASGMQLKGFEPTEAINICSGCYLAPSTDTFRVISSETGQDGSKKEIRTISAPFYMDPLFANDSQKREVLRNSLRSVRTNWKKDKSAPNATDLNLKALRSDKNEDALLIVIGSWVEMTRSKSLGGELGTAAVTGAIFGLPIVSTSDRPLIMDIHIVDAQTGEVVWADGIVMFVPNDMTLHNMKNLQKRLVDRLPSSI